MMDMRMGRELADVAKCERSRSLRVKGGFNGICFLLKQAEMTQKLSDVSMKTVSRGT